MSKLYEELIIDILLRLSVKSLLRFRCVSKFWRDLIDSKYFIDMHRQQSINSNTNFHVVFQNSSDKLYSCSEYFDSDGLKRSLTELDFPVAMSYQGIGLGIHYFCVEVIGCCNGLLCTQFRDFDYALWNPFTRRYNKLPQAPKLEFDLLKNSKTFKGFGYDHVNDDYKVLIIFQIFYPDSIIHNQICVYSLKLNSWKHIEDCPYGDRNYEFKFNRTQGCFVNGASHWLAYPSIRDENGFRVQGLEWSIVAFNFEVEKFSTIPHPNANRNGKNVKIENLGGFLCICEEVCETCYVWVMKQYGVGESWIKLISLDLHSLKSVEYPNNDPHRYVKPLAYYSKNGEKLLMKTYFNTLTWYNLKEATSKVIRFPIKMRYFNSYMCLASLVSPYNGDDDEIAA